MLLSFRRVAVTTGAIITLIALAVYQVTWKAHFSHSLTLLRDFGNSSVLTEDKVLRFAYAQYATDMDYLCNAIINFNRLQRLGVKYDMVLIFPKTWDNENAVTREAKAIQNLRDNDLNVILRPFDILSTEKGDSTWRDSLTKFHAFSLIEYTRILAFDSDSLVLNNMDFLFFAPESPVAMPRAYWLIDRERPTNQILGSHLMLIEPNTHRYKKIISEAMRSGDFDMEVLNELFKDSAMILPHRRLALLTGEFRNKDHEKYLNPDEDEEWNAVVEADGAYLVHFSDWPLPKPWRPHTDAQWQSALPECLDHDIEKPERIRCADRFVWTGFYTDYNNDKRAYCH
ncbi:glycosyltransferase family 8 protein [Trichoderma chlorosporum]